MHKIIAFDFGTKSIGLAIGNDLLQTAMPLKAITLKNKQIDWKAIEQVQREWQADFFIVGLPLTVQGEMLAVSFLAKKFAKQLKERFTQRVLLIDERFSSTSARELLFAQGGRKRLDKGAVDCQSACIILETYFSSGAIDEII